MACSVCDERKELAPAMSANQGDSVFHDHDHDHRIQPTTRYRSRPVRVLAIDVGAGTQDVLIYDSDKALENRAKLILPSQTQVVAARVRAATATRRPIHLAG